jgi:hypothetical protein
MEITIEDLELIQEDILTIDDLQEIEQETLTLDDLQEVEREIKKEVIEKIKPLQQSIQDIKDEVKEEIEEIENKIETKHAETLGVIDEKISNIVIPEQQEEKSPDEIIEAINKGTLKIEKERLDIPEHKGIL